VADVLRVERLESPGIAIWTLDRPERKNALDHATMDALSRAISDARHDETLRAIILTGAGNVFVSGGDLRELRTATSVHDAERLADSGRRVCDGLAGLDVPVIAAVTGAAVGGGAELALACDLRIAEAQAKICFKQARMGVTTAWGAFPRLWALVGPSTTARLLYTAHEIPALEALSLGLVNAVVEPGAGVTTAIAWALDIAQGSPSAIAEVKGLLRHAAHAAAAGVGALERDRFVTTWTEADHTEAVEAYFAGRPPKWRSTPSRRRGR
jgi:enoyl-CoA hydratase